MKYYQILLLWMVMGLFALSGCGLLDEETLRQVADEQFVLENGQLPEDAAVDAGVPDWVSRVNSECYSNQSEQLYIRCWEPMAGARSYVSIERFPTEADAQAAFAARECGEQMDFHGYEACHNYTYRDASEPSMGGHYRITSIISWQDQHRIFEVQNEFHSTIPTGSEFNAVGLSEEMYAAALEFGLIVE